MSEENEIGSTGRSLIVDYLQTSPRHAYSKHTYTELFAFFNIEVDVILFSKDLPDDLRASVSAILVQAYLKGLESFDSGPASQDCGEIFDKRCDEYTAMNSSRVEKSDQIKKLNEYLNHAADMKCFRKEGDPLLLSNPIDDVKAMAELSDFYIEKIGQYSVFLADFIRT